MPPVWALPLALASRGKRTNTGGAGVLKWLLPENDPHLTIKLNWLELGYTMGCFWHLQAEEGRMASVLSCVHFALHPAGNGFAVKSQKSEKWKGI